MGGQNFVTAGPIPDSISDKIQSAYISGTTTNTIIAPVSGQRIYVHGMWAGANVNAGTVVCAFIMQEMTSASATVSTPLGTIGIGMNGMLLPYCQYPWFTTSPGNALAVNPNQPVGGRILYVQG